MNNRQEAIILKQAGDMNLELKHELTSFAGILNKSSASGEIIDADLSAILKIVDAPEINCLNDIDIDGFVSFFCRYPKYLAKQSQNFNKIFIHALMEFVNDKLRQYIVELSHMHHAPGFIYELISVWSVNQQTKLAKLYLDNFLKIPIATKAWFDVHVNCERYSNRCLDNPFSEVSSGYLHTLPVLINLVNYLEHEEVGALIDHLLYYIFPKEKYVKPLAPFGLKLVSPYLMQLASKLTSVQVNELLVMLNSNSIYFKDLIPERYNEHGDLREKRVLYQKSCVFDLLNSFKETRNVDGTPLIFDEIIFELIASNYTDTDTDALNQLTYDLRSHFSPTTLAKFFDIFLDKFDFTQLSKFNDLMRSHQCINVVHRYLEYLSTVKPFYHKNIDEAVLVFHDYFAETLYPFIHTQLGIIQKISKPSAEGKALLKLSNLKNLIPADLQLQVVDTLLPKLRYISTASMTEIELMNAIFELIVNTLKVFGENVPIAITDQVFAYLSKRLLTLELSILQQLRGMKFATHYWVLVQNALTNKASSTISNNEMHDKFVLIHNIILNESMTEPRDEVQNNLANDVITDPYIQFLMRDTSNSRAKYEKIRLLQEKYVDSGRQMTLFKSCQYYYMQNALLQETNLPNEVVGMVLDYQDLKP